MNRALRWAYQLLKKVNQEIIYFKIFRRVPWSTIYRLKTASDIYYLKINNPLYSIEGKLLNFFQSHSFQHIPKILGYNQQLNSILLENAGHNVHQQFDGIYHHILIKKAIEYYAEIQIHCSKYLNPLSQMIPYCCDIDHFSAIFDKFLTHHQDILLNDGLSNAELKKLFHLMPKIEHKCHLISSINIPNSIEHGDLFDENFLIKNQSLIVADWGDAGLGHPFFSYGFFLHRLVESYHPSNEYLLDLKKSYLKYWKKYYAYQDLNDILNGILQLSNLRTIMNYSKIACTNKNHIMPMYQGYLCQNALSFLRHFK